MKHGTTTYRFNYFQLTTAPDKNLLELFNDANLPESETNYGYVRLSSLRRSSKYITGVMGLVLTNNLPVKYNLTSRTKAPLELKSDEGVMYGTAFLFDVKRHVLIYQNSRPGVSAMGFIGYLMENNKLEVDPVLILDHKLMTKGVKGSQYKSIIMKLSNAGMNLFEKQMTGRELTAAADRLGAAWMTIRYDAPRNGLLSAVKITELLKYYLRDRGDYTSQVESLKIKCADLEGKSMLIDLMKQKMTFDLDYVHGRDNIAINEDNFLVQVTKRYEEELPRLLENLNLQKV